MASPRSLPSTPVPAEAEPARPSGSASTALLAAGVLIALLYYGRSLLMTLVVAAILACLLEPFVMLFMRARLPRSVSSFLVCGLAGLLLYLLAFGVYSQSVGLLEDLPAYSQRVSTLIDNVNRSLEVWEQKAAQFAPRRLPPPNDAAAAVAQAGKRRRAAVAAPPSVQEVRVLPEPTPIFTYVYASLSSLSHVLLLVSFVPFLLYFMLSWREHMGRSLLLLLSAPDRDAAGRSWKGIASMTRAYVIGNFILGLLLSAASAIVFWLFGLPYWTLTAPLSGFLSLVPYVGLPLAIVPPFFSAIVVYATVTPYLGIAAVVGLFHLIALNLLYPLVVGSRVHLNPLVVTVALMFWGTVWGGLGLVLAVPITAGIKAVCDNVEGLRGWGRLLGD